MRAFLFLLLASASIAQDIDNATYIDETGKRFTGPTESLELFSLRDPRSRCADTSPAGVIAWTLNFRSGAYSLKKLGLHVEIDDRAGKRAFSGDFKWDRYQAQDKPGYLTRCEGTDDPLYAIALPGNVSLKYATVRYWITEVVKEKTARVKESPGPRAFTLKDQLAQ